MFIKIFFMRTLLKASFDVNAANQAIKSGALPKAIKEITERLKPEASYFFPSKGKRSCLMVFDLKDPSDIPSIVEPLFMQMNAEVELTPVMNTDDLQKGLSSIMHANEHAGAFN